MNIVHHRSNTLTLYPNQNSSFTIIWLEMDTWNPPVYALHTPNSITINILTLINIGHHSARSFGLQNAYIKHPSYISQLLENLSLSLSLTHTHTHTKTNCSLGPWMKLFKCCKGNHMVNHTIVSKYWQTESVHLVQVFSTLPWTTCTRNLNIFKWKLVVIG